MTQQYKYKCECECGSEEFTFKVEEDKSCDHDTCYSDGCKKRVFYEVTATCKKCNSSNIIDKGCRSKNFNLTFK